MPRINIRKSLLEGRLVETLVPMTLVVVSLVAFALLWNSGERARRNQVAIETRVTAEQVRLRLEAWIDARTSAVELLASDWNEPFQQDLGNFRDFADRILTAYPEFQAINWIDADWVIREVNPPDSNRPALDQDLHGHPGRGVVTALHTAETTHRAARTPVIELLQGGEGFAIYRPVENARGEVAGFINGVFRIETLVDACLAEAYLRDRFHFSIADENRRTAYEHGRPSHQEAPAFRVVTPVRVLDRPWTLQFSPSQALLRGDSAFAAKMSLGVGLLLALILALTLRVLLQRQRALRESEAKYKLLVENQTDLIVRFCVDGRLRFASPSVCRTFEVEESDFDRGAYTAALHREDRQAHEDAISAITPAHTTSYVEVRMLTASGWRWIAWAFTGVIEANGSLRAIVGVGRDITERRRIQVHLLESQKLQAVGRLAEGVAHDFNNILQAILGDLALLEVKLKPDEKAVQSLNRLREASLRAAALTRQLLAFGRRQDLQPRELDLDHVVEGILKLVNSTIDEGIVVDFSPHGNLDPIRADVGQVEQVVVHLCENAVEAMPRGGTLTLQTRLLDADAPTGSPRDLTGHQRWVALEISDTGKGMDPETQSHIFEPFFSTKEMGRGTGLGLATVHGIVEQHGGCVEVQSSAGQGTLFRVLFPSSDTFQQVDRNHHPLPARGETLLMVRDPSRRTVLVDGTLRAAGYRVLNAPSLESGRDIAGDPGNHVNLIVLDLDRTGETAAGNCRMLSREVPHLPILCLCEDDDLPLRENDLEHGRVEILRVPFTPDSLLYHVRQLLDARLPRRKAG